MSALRLRKLLRDLWVTRTRVAMMIVAIAVSVVAVTGFLSARAILGREIAANYRDTHPASATLHVPGGVDPATLAAVRAQPGVLDAATRASLLVRARVGDGPWRVMLLFASDPADPMRIASVATQPGAWPPPPGALMLERTAFGFLGVSTGDTVLVAAPGAAPVAMTVSAAAHDGGVAPAGQEQTAYAYVTTDALARLGAPAMLDQVKIVVDSGDPRVIEASTQAIAVILAGRGHPVSGIDIPPPGRHPHQGQLTMVGFVLLAFGVMALLLSSVLVATMLGGMIAGQVRQIGAMKAIGARTRQIMILYLVQAALIAAAATALAAWPGLALGRVLARSGAGLLNLDLTSQAVPGWVYVVALAAGIAVPLLVALFPLARASRTTVRQAIDDSGADPAPGSGVWLARLRGPSRIQLMAVRNLTRRRGRLALSVGLLAVAGSMFLTGFNTARGWSVLVDQGIAHRRYDVEIRLDRPYPADRLAALASGTPGVSGAEAWGLAPTAIHVTGRVDVSRVYPDDSHASFTIMAPPAETDLLRLPLLAGRWLVPGDTDAVVLNNLVPAQQAPGIAVGDTITLTIAGRPITRHVVGIASDFGTQATAYLTDRDFAALAGTAGQARMLRVVTAEHDPAARQAALDRLDRALTAAGIGVEQEISVDTLQAALDGHVLVLADALLALALVMGLVGLLGLASALGTSVTERTREFGVLHAIGATPGAVRALVITEGVATGVLSLAVAVLAALPMTKVFGDFIGGQAFRQALPYQFSVPAQLAWTVLTLTGAAVASAAAARRASRMSIREALITV